MFPSRAPIRVQTAADDQHPVAETRMENKDTAMGEGREGERAKGILRSSFPISDSICCTPQVVLRRNGQSQWMFVDTN